MSGSGSWYIILFPLPLYSTLNPLSNEEASFLVKFKTLGAFTYLVSNHVYSLGITSLAGFIFLILMIFILKFMKSRVGLKVEEYPKDEVKYDKLKEISTEK